MAIRHDNHIVIRSEILFDSEEEVEMVIMWLEKQFSAGGKAGTAQSPPTTIRDLYEALQNAMSDASDLREQVRQVTHGR